VVLFCSVEEARIEAVSYIEGYYERNRRQTTQDCLSPDGFEKRSEISTNEKAGDQLEKKLA